MRIYICIISILFYGHSINAQGLSNQGKEFWLGYGHNVLFTSNLPVNAQTMVIYLSAEKATTVTVSINATGWSQTVNIPAKTVNFSITIPKSGPDDCRIISEGKFDKGIHIVSTEPIVAYTHQYGIQSSAATMLFPVEAYGFTYYSVNYTQISNFPNSFSWMYIVASEDNTKIEITPSDSTEGGWLPGQKYTIELNKGQLYNVFGKSTGNLTGKDLTGTRAASVEGSDGKCHPIGVYSGSSRITICSGDGGEFMQQQIFPASAWGTTYLTYHDIKNTGNDVVAPFLNYYRVIVSDPATIVKRNGVPLTSLINNFYYQFTSNSGDFIEADKPILVAQYTPSSNQCTGTANPPTGDPEMFMLAPLQQGIKSTTFYNTRRQNIDINYVDIIVHKNGLPSLLIDSLPPPSVGIITHPQNSDYVFVAKRLLGAGTQHTITCDSGFVAKVYGHGQFESYGYLAGTQLNNLNGLIKVENLYNSTNNPNTFTCPLSPFTLSVRLAYKATSILWEFSKTQGLSVNKDTLLNNPVPTDSLTIGGRKYFTYQLLGQYFATTTGSNLIPVTATSPEIDFCDKAERLYLILEVKKAPVADFTFLYNGCLSDSARFTGNPMANGYLLNRYVWYYDDNTRDSGLLATKKIPGNTHPVTFRVLADNGCLHDTTKTVTTTLVPVAKFGFDKQNICVGDSIRFTDTSSYNGGTITQWNWSFAGGNEITRTNGSAIANTFTIAGLQKVTLWINTDNNCKSDTAYGTITVKNLPSASFTIAGKQCVDSALLFTSTSNGNGEPIQIWNWDFGNGQILTSLNGNPQTTSYTTAGGAPIVLHWVSAGPGCISDTASSPAIFINPNPIASFRVSSDSFCTGSVLSFLDSSSTPGITNWQWNFGNGTTGTQALPFTKTYPSAGTYWVTVRVTTAQGCGSGLDSIVAPIVIETPPVINAGPDITIPAGQQATINASGPTATGILYQWTPANQLDNPNSLRPVASPNISTTYSLVASYNGNCSSTDSMVIFVITDVYVPNAFSPNGDGLNDIWNIPGLNGYSKSVLNIYNRYGQIIYTTKGFSHPWDGTTKGKEMPSGVYYYILDLGDGSPRRNGSITLLR